MRAGLLLPLPLHPGLWARPLRAFKPRGSQSAQSVPFPAASQRRVRPPPPTQQPALRTATSAVRLPRKHLTANGSALRLSGRCSDQSEREKGAVVPKSKGTWAGHLAAVANEEAAYRGAVGPAANGRRYECGGSLFELAAAADGGWRRVAPAVRGYRGRGMRAARPERVRCVGPLWGLRAPALPRGSSGRRPRCLGRAEPRARRHLLAREAAAAPRPVLSCPVLGHLPAERSGAFLGGPREGHGQRGRCSLSFPCFNKHIVVLGGLCPSGFPRIIGRSFLSVVLWGY